MTTRPFALCINSDPTINLLLKRYLNEFGFDCELFKTPKSFISRISETNPVLCLIDRNNVGKDDGIALIKMLRTKRTKELHIFLVSNSVDQNSAKFLEGLRVDDMLQKPIAKKVLAQKLLKLFKPSDLVQFVKKKDEVKSSLTPDLSSPETYAYPPVLQKFFENFDPILLVISPFLRSWDHVEARIGFQAEHLKKYESEFIAMMNSIRGKEEKIDLSTAIRMYGTEKTRDLLICIKLHEITKTTPFEWDPTTKQPKPKPDGILTCAVTAVNHFGADSRYASVGYKTGLIFDIIGYLATSDPSSQIKSVLMSRFEHSLKVSDSGYVLARKTENVELELYIAGLSILIEASKVLFAHLDSEYLTLISEFDQKNIPPHFQHVFELKKFGVTHTTLCSLVSFYLPGLGAQALSALFYDFPFLLSAKTMKSSQVLASIVKYSVLESQKTS